jgi:hypothetical protein
VRPCPGNGRPEPTDGARPWCLRQVRPRFQQNSGSILVPTFVSSTLWAHIVVRPGQLIKTPCLFGAVGVIAWPLQLEPVGDDHRSRRSSANIFMRLPPSFNAFAVSRRVIADKGALRIESFISCKLRRYSDAWTTGNSQYAESRNPLR